LEWLNALQGQVVGLDTAPLIYFIEQNPTYREVVDPFFESLAEGRFRAVTSVVTLLEVLVHPLRHGDEALAQQYRNILLNAEGLTTFYLSETIAEEAARLRASYHVRTPDAIQMATAAHLGAAFFLTHDMHLPSVPGLRMLFLSDLKASIS